MDAMKFAVNDEVMFTDAEGNLSLGLIEAIEGDTHTVRVLAQTADGTTVPTDIVLSLTAADLMPMDGAEEAEDELDLDELEGDESEDESEVEIELDLGELEGDEDLEEKALGELFDEEKPEEEKAVEDVDLTPTEEMAMEAAQGLEWRQEFNRGGTEVGVARARDISNRTQLSPETVFRMTSFFARHEVDKQAEGFNEGEEGYPSAGRIAWALWGGDPGRDWAERKARELEGEMEAEKGMPVFKLGDWVTYESEAGPVTAKITDIITEGAAELEGMEPVKASPEMPVYVLDVYEPVENGMAFNGIQTAMCGDKLKMCDEPKMGAMKHLPRFIGKLKKAEVMEEGEIGYVKGYLSIFDNVDLGGDVVKRGAFKRTLDHKGGKTVFMLDHGYKTDEVLGVLELEEDQRGLMMTGKINLKTVQGRNTFETIKFQAKEGVPIGASIGYEIKQAVPNKTGGMDLTEVELWEGSVTPFPMNQEALITEAYKRYNREARAKRARLYRALKQ